MAQGILGHVIIGQVHPQGNRHLLSCTVTRHPLFPLTPFGQKGTETGQLPPTCPGPSHSDPTSTLQPRFPIYRKFQGRFSTRTVLTCLCQVSLEAVDAAPILVQDLIWPAQTDSSHLFRLRIGSHTWDSRYATSTCTLLIPSYRQFCITFFSDSLDHLGDRNE